MMNSTTDIMERGINCLLEELGTIETERFIATIIRERFDYTKWRREYFGDATIEELNAAAARYGNDAIFYSGTTQRLSIPIHSYK